MRLRCGWRRVALALVGVGLTVGGAGGQARAVGSAQEEYGVEVFTVAERRKDQTHPRISGDWVVWKDYRDLPQRQVDGSPNAAIYALNRVTGDEIQVSESKDTGDPSISNGLVVWTTGRSRTTEIYGVELPRGRIFAVTRSPGRQERPAISDNLIVWQDTRNGNWDIFARDLSGDADISLVDQRNDQTRPAVSGRTVVWEDWRDGGAGPDIFGIDLDSQQAFRVTTNHDAFEPAISGRWVVWVGAADPGVFAKNLDNGRTRRISRGGGAKSQPAISGDLVVWTDERNGDRDVFGYDLVMEREFPVIVSDGAQDDPHIDGTTVVWSDGRGPNRDIVGAALSLPRPLDATGLITFGR